MFMIGLLRCDSQLLLLYTAGYLLEIRRIPYRYGEELKQPYHFEKDPFILKGFFIVNLSRKIPEPLAGFRCAAFPEMMERHLAHFANERNAGLLQKSGVPGHYVTETIF